MGECDCASCEKCKAAAGENALELYRLRVLLDEVRNIVGTAVDCPEKLRPAVIWERLLTGRSDLWMYSPPLRRSNVELRPPAPCPGCDVQHSNDPLACLALGVALGASFADMHSITELMCRNHRMPYTMAMLKASIQANTTVTEQDLPT